MIFSHFSFPGQPELPDNLNPGRLAILTKWELTKGGDKKEVNYQNVADAVKKRPNAGGFVVNIEGWEKTQESVDIIQEWMTAIRAASGKPVAFWNNRTATATSELTFPKEFYNMGDFYCYGFYLYANRPTTLDWFQTYPPILERMLDTVDVTRRVIVTVSPVIFGVKDLNLPDRLMNQPDQFGNITEWLCGTGQDVCVWAGSSITKGFPWDSDWEWYTSLTDVADRYSNKLFI